MDGEANCPDPPGPTTTKNDLVRPINPDFNLSRSFTSTSSSSSSSFSSSSPPDFLRHVQAAFKRHRPLGTMQSNSIKPRRSVVTQRETSKISPPDVVCAIETKKPEDEISMGHKLRDSNVRAKRMVPVGGENREDASITPPSISGAVNTYDENSKPFDVRRENGRVYTGCKDNDTVSSLVVEPQRIPLIESQKKVQFALGNNTTSQGADDQMATGTGNILSHLGSLALTEMERDVSNQVETSTANGPDSKHQNLQTMELDASLRSDGRISSLLAKRTEGVQDQVLQFRNFLQSELNHPITQSSVVGSSCATTTSINLASAPLPNSTTHCSRPLLDRGSHVAVGCLGDSDVNYLPMTQEDVVQPSHLPSKCANEIPNGQTATAPQAPASTVDTHLEVKEYNLCKEQQGSVLRETNIQKDPSPLDGKSTHGKDYAGDLIDAQTKDPVSKNPSLDMKLESSRSEKQEKAASGKAVSAPRKRSYDPDLFFKVNGKLYQRLGKIGSGGSSEVHKVISSDCTIYALKKIKLKGRDYATAYGFCQEIEYLNKLKGKNNIIQLIDYEVTDKALLQEVMNGSMSNKDSRVKEDGYIYMVLEYGEIDLAHMLSQKWKEMNGSNSIMDENWLRFYWQQILQAVNTIHEERIVHSDLKPANFLLVRGSLKLIDFGIAKAIMSDTTNIQRDSQVGTLSYMSPEAFMCNETDANGNTIKCGRPSDIWSLGCILYQMVYGRTPFSEYKTFWAKFKVITDQNHEITYEPVSNPWLLDLMKKCLAWDRNERWRIPQLLQHPFLVPPVPPQISSQDQSCKLLQLITESCENDQKVLTFCCQLQQLLRDPRAAVAYHIPISRDQQHKLLCEMSSLCFQLREHLANSERD